MYVLAAAVAISAWLILLGLDPAIRVEQARALKELIAHNLTVSQPVHLYFGDRGFRFPDLVEATQKQLDFRLAADGVPYRYPLVDRLPTQVLPPKSELEEALARGSILTDDADALSSVGTATNTHGGSSGKKGQASDLEPANSPQNSSAERDIPEYSVELYFQNQAWLSLDLELFKARMAYTLDFVHENDLPFFVTQAIYDMLLQPDLAMRKEVLAGGRKLGDLTRHLKINFVAAEELGNTRTELTDAILQHMQQFKAILPYVEIVPAVHVLNVLKNRAAAHLLQNTTSELTFFYLTTMRPYADFVQSVPLRHIDAIENEGEPEGPFYGTERLQQMHSAQVDTFDVTSFLEDVTTSVKNAVRLTNSSCGNLGLMAESAMKHYTISGLLEILDVLIAEKHFDAKAYVKALHIVDDILLEEKHDWARHLSDVTDFFKDINEKPRRAI